jgi:5-formyltetrahydrofolate cyclo-ligase
MQQRPQLRAKIRLRRNRISKKTQERAAESLSAKILCHPSFANASNIGFYAAFDGEISCTQAILAAHAQGKQCCLPKVKNTELTFHAYTPEQILQANRFGILEPHENAAEIAMCKLDVVIVPCIALDAQHYRLGYGGGYYDRSFAFRKEQTKPHPLLLAAVYDFQQCSDLCPKSWDVPCDDAFVIDSRTL